MEREILYRGKCIDNGEWVEGYFVKYQSCASEEKIICGIVPEYASALYLNEIDPSTVGQYTGLTDKNGIKIFEGDIVITQYGRLCVVIWHQTDCHCGWDLYPVNDDHKPPSKWCAFNSDCLEVVSNIYDNPEMLKGEDLK